MGFKKNKAVFVLQQAYGSGSNKDLLEILLALNLELAARERHGEPIIIPWDPTQ